MSFASAPSLPMTADSDTSLPVPAVVGTATQHARVRREALAEAGERLRRARRREEHARHLGGVERRAAAERHDEIGRALAAMPRRRPPQWRYPARVPPGSHARAQPAAADLSLSRSGVRVKYSSITSAGRFASNSAASSGSRSSASQPKTTRRVECTKVKAANASAMRAPVKRRERLPGCVDCAATRRPAPTPSAWPTCRT